MITDRFTVLFVCHANVCRSPMAERLARRALWERLGPLADAFEVHSAGTHAVPDQAMHPYTARVLGENHADPDGFLSRLVDPAMVTTADLVLTASRRHRAHCVTLAPRSVSHTFTIRQFGRLAAAVAATRTTVGIGPDTRADPRTDGPDQAAEPLARARSLVVAAAAARSRVQPVSAEQDDLADPVLRPIGAFRDCARQVRQTLDTLLDIITKS
ncbi:low molecular weight phosphatase family protein [Solwaraspora sp. WMMD406]|uniref:arsenate reductase/protein-tyrosine-phosphatase family protein n=1 Tax=Solwaraspora sp. WMMD406 TaxID=3016095 RepID=UPI002415AE65|nr:low molecular weight phosphatase family protein [Solwaraspora sp. WMMD406]MDG4766076.1 low molecular weight phosphatase family protein [Solwaraspora sp. WMMD406]